MTPAPVFSAACAKILLVAALVLPTFVSPARAADDTDITAIWASTANNYQRQRGPDGKFLPEHYAFADGGRTDGTYTDKSMEGLTFLKVAQTVAAPLREQNYLPAARGSEAKLMIVLFWGVTMGADAGQYSEHVAGLGSAVNSVASLRRQGLAPANPNLPDDSGTPEGGVMNAAVAEMEMQMMMNNSANAARDRNNRRNAAMVGFYEEIEKAQDLPIMLGLSQSIIEEIESDRYFVVLKAYDFQELRKNKKKVPLWETRFSVRQRNNRFDAMLPIMARNASKYFGQQSGRLLREVIPVGRVEVGTPTVVPTSEDVPATK